MTMPTTYTAWASARSRSPARSSSSTESRSISTASTSTKVRRRSGVGERGGQLVLNRPRVMVWADSDIRGKGVDDVIVVKDYNMLQWLNVSAYRTSHYPYAAQFYDMADERGIVRTARHLCLEVAMCGPSHANSRLPAGHH